MMVLLLDQCAGTSPVGKTVWSRCGTQRWVARNRCQAGVYASVEVARVE
jgi:hypothetical protein